ncbi:MAG: NAD(+)--dinitrogen-reductase ADP-D-ribosyltransferase, partial [Hydrogenophaga sp.]
MDDDEHDQPQRWTSTNLVGVSTAWLASAGFNERAPELHIAGTRETQPGLFALLDRCDDLTQAREVFVHYLSIAFGLQAPEKPAIGSAASAEPRRWRGNWRRLLQGW